MNGRHREVARRAGVLAELLCSRRAPHRGPEGHGRARKLSLSLSMFPISRSWSSRPPSCPRVPWAELALNDVSSALRSRNERLRP